jgi:glycosyltransferase involved in cell wall biosynthesis
LQPLRADWYDPGVGAQRFGETRFPRLVDRITQPSITVVIPNKGRIDLLEMAIASLQSQALPDWEALIVDDGSTEEELETVRQIIAGDSRIRLVIRDCPPAGANHCRNLGVQLARSDLIVFLDSDDMLSPACLEARVAAMKAKPELAFVVFAHEHFREHPGDMNFPWLVGDQENHLDRLLMMHPPWQTAGPTWRRSTLNLIGQWDETLPAGQDWDYHVRALSLELPHEIVSTPRFFHRLPGPHRDSISGAKQSPLRVASREKMFVNAYQLLLAKGLITPLRRVLFARLFLAVSEQWATLRNLKAADQCWKRTWELGLISSRQYREGLLLFHVHRIGILRRAIRLYTLWCWPKQLRHRLPSKGAP